MFLKLCLIALFLAVVVEGRRSKEGHFRDLKCPKGTTKFCEKRHKHFKCNAKCFCAKNSDIPHASHPVTAKDPYTPFLCKPIESKSCYKSMCYSNKDCERQCNCPNGKKYFADTKGSCVHRPR